MYIYCITNLINNKKYVGLSTKTVEESKNYYGSGILISKSLKKNGKINFKKEILENNLTIDIICEREIYWIKEIDCKYPNGYNLCDGGQGTLNPSDETRLKMSKAKKGVIPYNKGKSPSDETRKNMSDSHKGIPGYYKGMTLSEEHKKSLSLSHMGNIPSNKGIPMSEESKKKLSDSKKNISEESKIKMRQNRPNNKKLSQIDINNGEVVNIFQSTREACRVTGYARKRLINCTKHITESAYGYKWEVTLT